MRIGPTELGALINTSKQNVYGIFKRKSIDTQLLAKISRALAHDFFLYYVKDLGLQSEEIIYHPENVKKARECLGRLEVLEKEMEELKKENDFLKKENDFLKRINHLLEEKLK